MVRLSAWFEDFEAKEWDQEFEEDVQNGKLDKLAKQAIKEFQEGKCTVTEKKPCAKPSP